MSTDTPSASSAAVSTKRKFTAGDILPLIKQAGEEWVEDKAPKMAGALAYFTAIALAPLMIIAIKIIGVVYRDAATKVHDQLAHYTDPNVANALQTAIEKAGEPGTGFFASVISVVIALFGASGVFGEMQDSLNTIWEVRPKPNRGIMGVIQDRFLSIAMVVGTAFLLLVSMVVSSLVTGVSNTLFHSLLGGDGTIAKVVAFSTDIVLSTAVVTVLFSGIFKLLPDVKVAWRDVWLGGFVTAILFQVGKYGLGFYLGKAAPGSAYGAAGSLVAMLLWVYYSAFILYFGAEFTQVYANQFGSHIVPADNAEPLTEEMRQQAGIPHTNDAGQPVHVSTPAAALKPGRARPAPTGPRFPALPIPHAKVPFAVQPFRYHPERRTYVDRWLPLLVGGVVGRAIWKHYHPDPIQALLKPEPVTFTSLLRDRLRTKLPQRWAEKLHLV